MRAQKVFELMLELGHKSSPLPKPSGKTPNHFTHKWTTFVRGKNDTKIENCIDKVVFNLHEDFSNHRREIFKPPYQVTEMGYASFVFPIEIYFKNKETPNHVIYEYDLNLMVGKKCRHLRYERIKFINPNKEFEKCLLKSGAQMVSGPRKSPLLNDGIVKTERSPPPKKQKSSIIPTKDMYTKSTHTNGTSSHEQQHQSQISRPSSQSAVSHPHPQLAPTDSAPGSNKGTDSFMDFFGTSISSKPTNNHHSHQHHNQHHNNNNNNHSSNTRLTPPPPPPPIVAPVHTAPVPIPQANVPMKSSSAQPSIRKEKKPRLNDDSSKLKHSSSAHKSNGSSHSSNHKSSNQAYLTDLALIQTKLANLSDCDRLQKIVDIIDESGDWFNITDTKFIFDLERLHKKTLHKIEKYLYI